MESASYLQDKHRFLMMLKFGVNRQLVIFKQVISYEPAVD